ncbi:MAG TPA: hypothetical protein ENL41_01915 [candidate division WOR-3 bacterium]|uniref:Regulator of microtubule dynamics protein 1 n=1 Tax=candidate division WOR-3 bacterium TaxID=2052148 RepID=A0A7C5I4K2_UNCW3|nr:hypothetical protein [candidate division WOR-3 bacterium]
MMVKVAYLISVFISLGVSPEECISKGDSLFFAMKYEEALEIYEEGLSVDSTNYELLWRASRCLCNIGDVAPKEEREKIYEDALKYAEKAVKANPQGDWGWTWLAASYGNLALFRGGKGKVKLAMKIKEAVLRALELNPNNHLANYIWGSYNFEAATLNWALRKFAKMLFGEVPEGTLEDAEKYIKKAVSLKPDRIKYRLELAKLYKKMEKKEEAIRELEITLNLKPQYKEDYVLLKEAEELLRKLKK